MNIKRFKRDKLRLYAFLTVCLLISILLSVFDVFSADNISFIDKFGISSVDVLNQEDFESSSDFIEGLSNVYISKSSTAYSNILSFITNNNFSFPSSNNDKYYDTYFSNNSYVYLNSGNNDGSFYCVPSNSFCTYSNNTFYLFVPSDYVLSNELYNYNQTEFIISRITFNHGNYLTFNNVNFDSGVFSVDDSNYYRITISIPFDYSTRVMLTDLPIYYTDGTDVTSLNGAHNINYSYSGGSGGVDETSDNNLVLTDGDWTFSNTKFSAPYNSSIDTGSVYPTGTVSFSFNPNDYQLDHKDDFRVRLSFSFDYDVNYKNWGDSFSVFDHTDELLNNQKNYHARWLYDSGDLNYIYVPLTDFVSSGNTKSFTFQDILSNCKNRAGGYDSVLRSSKELVFVSYNKFNLNCTAEIVADGSSSGAISEWYNPMNKKGYTTDASGKTNSNPFDGSNNTDVPVSGGGAGGTAGVDGDNSNNVGGGSASGGSGGAGGSSSSNYNGSITINNNPVNNVNSSGGSGSGGGGSQTSESAINFYNTFNPFVLIFNKLNNGNSTISDETADTIGSNTFISLMSSVFSFIPIAMWDTLSWYLVASLGILIVAVVLRIILDLL